MTKMATMRIYGENPSRIFFSRSSGQISTKLSMKHRCLKHYNVYLPAKETPYYHNIHLFFSFYNVNVYFSDINFDSPVNSLSHNLNFMTFRLMLVALPRNFYSQRVMIPLSCFQIDTGIRKRWWRQNQIRKMYASFDAYFLCVTSF